MSENDEGSENFKCQFKDCQESFCKRLDLHQHLFYEHQKFEPECPICQMKFTSFKHLRLHEKIHGDYVCQICDQRFNEKHYLKAHLLTHEERRQKFKCHLCDKSFLYKGNLGVHFKAKHKNERYKCLICERSLSTKQKLDEHMIKKHKSNEQDIVVSLKDLEGISTDEEYRDQDEDDDDDDDNSEYGQTMHRIKSNFYLKKQDSFNNTQSSYNLSKEDFEMLLDEDVFCY